MNFHVRTTRCIEDAGIKGYAGIVFLFHHSTKHVIVEWTGCDVDQNLKADTEDALLSVFTDGIGKPLDETVYNKLVEEEGLSDKVKNSQCSGEKIQSMDIAADCSKEVKCSKPKAKLSPSQIIPKVEVVAEQVMFKESDKGLGCLREPKKHVCTQTEQNLYQCTRCAKSFHRQSQLARHSLFHHCATCGKSYKRLRKLEKHARNHMETKLSHECELCAKTFDCRDNLEVHVRVHRGEKPFPCLRCPKKFSHQATFTRHTQTHTEQQPCGGKLCAKGPTDSSNSGKLDKKKSHKNKVLKRLSDKKKVVDKKTRHCPICGVICVKLSDLKSHLKTHSSVV